MTISTDDPRPEDFAAVVSVRYEAEDAEQGGGASVHGLDAEEADALATVLYLGFDDLANASAVPSEDLGETVDSLINSLQRARGVALWEAEDRENTPTDADRAATVEDRREHDPHGGRGFRR